MEFKLKKDKILRKQVLSLEWKRRVLKSIIKNELLSEEERQAARKELNKLMKSSSVVRIRNRCLVTGRGSSVFSFAKVSDIVLREQASEGNLFGFIKSSKK